MSKINLNDTVSVILTQYGADKVNKIYADMSERVPHFFPRLEYSEGDRYTTQLWVLFEDFGEDIYLSAVNLPFKNNEIFFED